MHSSSLKDRKCVPCEEGTPALDDATTHLLLGEVPSWRLDRQPGKPPRITRQFEFKDFLAAVGFINKMASIAESEAHHPDFCVHYNRIDVTLWTHTVNGLSENDFILASKLDAVLG